MLDPKKQYTLNMGTQQSGLQSVYTPPKTTTSSTSTSYKPPVWGIPQSGGFPSPNMSTAQSTSPYGANVPNTQTPNIPTTTPTTSTPSGTSPQSTTTQGTPQGDYASRLADIQSGMANLQSNFASYQANQSGQRDQQEGKYPQVEKSKDSEYLKFMKGLQDPDGLKMAYQSQTDLAKMTADEIARTREGQEEIQKNEAGMIERGQKYLSQDLDRASAKTLADLAIAKGYNTDIINQQLNLGKTIGEAEDALRKEGESPLTLEEAQSLGLPFGTTMAEARMAGKIPQGVGTSPQDISSMATMVANGQMDIANVPSEMRGQVASEVINLGGVNPETSPYLQEIASNGLTAVDGLLSIANSNPGIFGKTAAVPWPDALRTDDYRNYEAQLDYLKGNIIPAALTAMREASKTGGALGQVSDREGAWLASSLGALSMKQSPSAIIEQLKLVQQHLQAWQKAVDEYADESGGGEGLYSF